MTRRLVFRSKAETELAEAVDLVRSTQPESWAEFLGARRSHRAGAAPSHALSSRVRHARRATLRRFPYNLIYTVHDDVLLIAACIHSRRDRTRWQKRI
jgi:hypothetical protein